MNNRFVLFIPLVFAILATAVSCEKPEETGNPEVNIEVLSCDYSSVTFSITPENADRCAYVVLPSTEPAPDASSILSQGISVSHSEKSENTADGLMPGSGYNIYAVCTLGEKTGNVAKASFTTENGEDPSQGEPTATVTVTDKDYNSVEFTIKPENALQCAYMIIKEGDREPSAEEILETGTAADASGAGSYREKNLASDCGYNITVAVRGETETVTVTESFRTEVSPYDVDFTAYYLGGEFYGDWLDFGNDNFYIQLSDVGVNENGTDNPDGNFLLIDLYSPFAEDQNNPAPAPGEYKANSTDQEFSINCGYSYYYYTDHAGEICGKTNLAGGTMVIKKVDLVYKVTADFTLADGQTVHCEYEGPFVLPAYNDNSDIPMIENSISTTFKGASAVNYGNDFGAYNVAVLLWDMEENTSTGNLIAPGHLLKLDLMTDFADGNITPGEYEIDAYGTNAPFTYLEGSIMDFYGIHIPVGTYIQYYNSEGEVDGYGFINGGTVNIQKDGNGYKFDLKLTMNGEYTLEATFAGELEMTYDQQSSASCPTSKAASALRRNRENVVFLK